MKPSTLVFVACSFVVAVTTAATTSPGLSGCPCIPPEFVGSTYKPTAASSLRVPTSSGLKLYNDSVVFGSSCLGWDALIGDIYDLSDRSYCYVDVGNCNVASYPTSYFPNLGLQYSYLTCGEAEAQQKQLEVAGDALQGQTLRYAYPRSSTPWHFNTHGHWTGAVSEFFFDLERAAGFTGVLQNVSDVSLGMFSSPWDACVHDVRMGVLDICVSVVMETDTRRRMASFTSPIMAGAMKLMVRRVASESKWDVSKGYDSVWFSFLKPFSIELWILTIATLFCGGLLYVFLELGDDKPRPPVDLAAQSARKGFYHGMVGFFVAGGDLGETESFPGAILRTAFGVFAVVMLSTYTANLATLFVLSGSTHSGIQSIADCDPPSAKCSNVCVEGNKLSLIAAQHPSMQVVVKVSSWDLVTGLAAGECDAAIVPEHDARARQDYQEAMIENDFLIVGEPVFQVYVGFPARTDLVQSLSFHALTLVYSGKFSGYYNQFRFKAIDNFAGGSDNDTDGALTPEDMVGVFTLFAFAVLVAFGLGLYRHFTERASNFGANHELGAESDTDLGEMKQMVREIHKALKSSGTAPSSFALPPAKNSPLPQQPWPAPAVSSLRTSRFDDTGSTANIVFAQRNGSP